MNPYMKRGVALGALLSLVLCGGCKVGYDYTPTCASVNQSYIQVDETRGIRQEVGADVSSWWGQIQDATLSRLTSEAVSNNLTLREALFRIQSARATLGSTQANAYPQFTESGGYTYGRSGALDTDYNDWTLLTSMSWELDVFGRLQRATEVANANMEELRELYRNAYVILCADVARAYVDARSYQEQIRISEENIGIQSDTLEITRTKYELGSASKLDENQALGVYKGTESSILTLQTYYQQTLNRMSILLGRTPGYVDSIMKETEDQGIPQAPEEILVGIPADLLRRRPDIRAAEQRVIAQNARVGVAIGDLYPIFSLNGSFGLDSDKLENLFEGNSINASIGPSFRWNILNFGKYRFNVEAQRFTHQELIVAYRQAVLEAAQQVDDSLVSYVNERDRVQTLSDAVDAYTDAYNLSKERYQSGQIDFQRLLDSQAGKLSYELQFIQCQASMMVAIVQLYRSLGGDWMGSATTASDEYAPMGQNETSGRNSVASNRAGTPGRYTTRREESADPNAQWRERQERSLERVAMALREEEILNESADPEQ
ncbi:MAG: efflux transporter outer membrane subunit [Thermoguttaceae bacterium]|nr:efflux transporter outer membrane subunit [Thermoguttaceae bacterium]